MRTAGIRQHVWTAPAVKGYPVVRWPSRTTGDDRLASVNGWLSLSALLATGVSSRSPRHGPAMVVDCRAGVDQVTAWSVENLQEHVRPAGGEGEGISAGNRIVDLAPVDVALLVLGWLLKLARTR